MGKVPRILTKVKSLSLLLVVNLCLSWPADGEPQQHHFDVVEASDGRPEPTFDSNSSAKRAAGKGNPDATRNWLLVRLYQALSQPGDLNRISSLLYGLVSDRAAAEQAHTRRALLALGSFVRTIEPTALNCVDLVNLRFITGFLSSSGLTFEIDGLDRRLYQCLLDMTHFEKASALFVLCRFPSPGVSRQELSQAVVSVENLQQADGSFGARHGLQRYYFTSHVVFALHACRATPAVIRRGQAYLLNELPALKRFGFLDGLLESLTMLSKMGVEIADERHYTDYLYSRIKADGSICFFDQPGCRSDVHATSLLLEFLREFGD